MPIFSYIRVSGRNQVEGDGFARQRETIGRWLIQNPDLGRIDHEFVENGYTGTDFERPALGKLLEFCKEWGLFRDAKDGDFVKNDILPDHLVHMGTHEGWSPITVLVERSDRLARESLTSELILKEFREMGVQVIDCEANLELTHDDDPSKVLIRQILQAVAEFDKSSIVKKLRRARDRKRAKDGRCEGAKPYGSIGSEAIVLDRILYLSRNKSMGCEEIARSLNDSGVRTRSGGAWNRGTIHRIIKASEGRR